MFTEVRSAAARVCRAIARRLAPELQGAAFPVGRPIPGGFIDCVKIDPCGLIRVLGWLRTVFDPQQAPSISVDGAAIPLLRYFRFPRADVSAASGVLLSQTGLELNYLIREPMIEKNDAVLTLGLATGESLKFELHVTFFNPHYGFLLHSNEVVHRGNIYGSGPPNVVIHPEIVKLAKELNGPTLDFGCGRGVLIDELQKAGIEAYGLELESDVIRTSIPADRWHWITLYDGSFPSPFPDGRFRSVVCSEVLEHIPDYSAAVKDIARLAIRKGAFHCSRRKRDPARIPSWQCTLASAGSNSRQFFHSRESREVR